MLLLSFKIKMSSPSYGIIKILLIVNDLKNKMKVKTKITSDFTNHNVNGCIKNMCKCAHGTLFSL